MVTQLAEILLKEKDGIDKETRSSEKAKLTYPMTNGGSDNNNSYIMYWSLDKI